MLRNHFVVAFRIFKRTSVHSILNILGLSIGMAISIVIGLWVYDEISFNKFHQNYHSVAKIMFSCNYNDQRIALDYNPYLMGEELRTHYSENFEQVVMSTFTEKHIISKADLRFNMKGRFVEPGFIELLSLKIQQGDKDGLTDAYSIFLSGTAAKAIYGDKEPIGQLLKVDNSAPVTVRGVYEDIPANSDFKDLSFIIPWDLYLTMIPSVEKDPRPWSSNHFQTFVQIRKGLTNQIVSSRIKGLRNDKLPANEINLLKPDVFTFPMNQWHLYSASDDAVQERERIYYVWLVGAAGVFILLLACVNFVNLATAKSENRAKEVGVRKAIGSSRAQLIRQFFMESSFSIFLAFLLSIVIAAALLPILNQLSYKQMEMPWTSIMFWLILVFSIILVGLAASSYPAIYLSSFQAASVLSGVIERNTLSVVFRRGLTVLQFTVSITLMICTITIYRQIRFSQERPIGYDREGLISIDITPAIKRNFNAIRNEIKTSNTALEVAASVNTTTQFNKGDVNLNWRGRDPGKSVGFAISRITKTYGKTVGWDIIEGRDFSEDFVTDSTGVVLNESARNLLAFSDPIGEFIEWDGKNYHIIGVIRDIVFESPYRAVTPSMFHISDRQEYLSVTVKPNPQLSMQQVLSSLENIFSRYNPEYPFEYTFVDEQYLEKFRDELIIGQINTNLSIIAIFISCLGLFGMASFVTEQRKGEVCIRKILGASSYTVWYLLVKDFIRIVLISFVISAPVAYFFMKNWLQGYPYHTTITWWIFISAGLGALLIALLTVSYEVFKTVLSKPILPPKSS